MVVKMKKVEILLYHKEKEQFLEELRKAGVVHITEKEHITEASDLQELNTLLRRAERVYSQLKKLEKERTQSSYLEKTTFTPDALIERFEELEESIEKNNQEINALHKEIKLIEPWGEFDPILIKKLETKGIKIRFFITSEKSFAKIDRKKFTIEEISRKEGSIYFVLIEKDQENDISNLHAEEVHLPQKSLSSLKKSLEEAEASINKCRKEMEALSFHTNLLLDYLENLKEEIAYKSASLSISEVAEGKVLYLQGWFPFNKEKIVIAVLQKFSTWFKISDPLPNDSVPVMVQNGPFARLFEPILKIYSLPDYFELDPTPFFAPFFMLFFGLCFGDLGYGLILTLLGLIGVFKLSKNLKSIAMLIIILGLSTSLSGILLNSLFGHTIFGGPGIQEGTSFLPSGAEIFSPLSPVETEKGTSFPMMSFALVLGVIQIFVGMILKAINQILYGSVAGAIQPLASLIIILCIIMMGANAHFLNMHQLVIGPLNLGSLLTIVPSSVLSIVIVVALILFLLFNNLQLKIFLRPLMGLWELYQFVSGVVGNILSYLRLFALGLSGGLLGAAFNYIAFMLVTKDGVVNYKSPMIIGTIIILIAGHGLNFALSIIGSFVHPLRLTFVEFYGNLGFKGGGKPYNPLRKLRFDNKSQ